MKKLRIDGEAVEILDQHWEWLEQIRKLRGLDKVDEIIIEAVTYYVEKHPALFHKRPKAKAGRLGLREK